MLALIFYRPENAITPRVPLDIIPNIKPLGNVIKA